MDINCLSDSFCIICDKKLSTKSNLTRHNIEFHNTMSQEMAVQLEVVSKAKKRKSPEIEVK